MLISIRELFGKFYLKRTWANQINGSPVARTSNQEPYHTASKPRKFQD
jgi:hypothetical protein